MSRCDGRWWRGGGGWVSQTDAAQPVACLENVLDAGLMLLPSQLSNAVLIVYLSPSAVPPFWLCVQSSVFWAYGQMSRGTNNLSKGNTFR